jgi:hypothetical protein
MSKNNFALDYCFGAERYRDLLDDHFYPYIAEGRRPRRFDSQSRHDKIRQMKLKIDLELELHKGEWQDIEEKVVRWPVSGNPHTAFFYETESCSRPGMVTPGWIRKSEAETLLYAFEVEKRGLDIYLCEEFQEIKNRFWEELKRNPNCFPCSRNTDRNQSQGRLVPIGFIVCNFNVKRYFLTLDGVCSQVDFQVSYGISA